MVEDSLEGMHIRVNAFEDDEVSKGIVVAWGEGQTGD